MAELSGTEQCGKESKRTAEIGQVEKNEGLANIESIEKGNKNEEEEKGTRSDEIFKKPTLPVLIQKPTASRRCSGEASRESAGPGQETEDKECGESDVRGLKRSDGEGSTVPAAGPAGGGPGKSAPAFPKSGCETVAGGSLEARGKRSISGVVRKPSFSNVIAGPPLPYKEPPWGGVADSEYSFEVLKNGSIVSTVPLTKQSFYVFGRLTSCDVSLEHPSISRYHAVVQFRRVPSEEHGKGFYIYDLGSTHGTSVNKIKIQPKTYFRLKVGYIIKFGGSSRLFVLQGPDDDQEEESELTVTQLKELRRQQQKELEKRMLGEDSDEEDGGLKGKETEQKSNSSKTDDTGCSWGMAEDAEEEEEGEEEEESEENPFAVDYHQEREALYIKDPKKALQGFFDREGEELEYEYEDESHGTWLCRVRLPVDDASGRQLVAEATHSGKKKEAMIQCSLEACRILDARGLLRQEAVSRKRRAKNWEEEDFYDSDDDAFLDRTGSVEKKRLKRMKQAGKIEEKPETYDSLLAKLSTVEKELSDIEAKLMSAKKGSSQSAAEDPLDAFMTEIKSGGVLDSITRKKLHLQSFELKKEEQRLKKLIKIAKPTSLPELKSQNGNPSTESDTKAKKKMLPMFGAMKGGSKFKLRTGTIGKLPPKRPELPKNLFQMKDEGPEEEEEDEEVMNRNKNELNTQDSVQETEEKKVRQGIDMSQSVNRASCNDADHELLLQSEARSDEGKKSERGHTSKDEGKCQVSSTTVSTSGSGNSLKEVPEKKRRVYGPSKPPAQLLSSPYPEDNPDYCVWVPPADQSGDGRTHLNDKYGY